MAKEYIESKCGSCIHSEACAAWIQHGSALYSDFSYSVEDCPHYIPTADVVEVPVQCKDCKYGWKCCSGKIACQRDGRVAYEMLFESTSYCSYGERRDD